jgi:hypothetical protein
VGPVLYFPEDEFTALQTGVPLSKFIKKLEGVASVKKIAILAHSLGNMVVNSALKQLGSASKPIRYVMNEAAVPADAFDANYTLTGGDTLLSAVDLWKHAIRLGYMPTADEQVALAGRGFTAIPVAGDVVWESQWTDIVKWQDSPCDGLAGIEYLICTWSKRWRTEYAHLNPALRATIEGTPAAGEEPGDSPEVRLRKRQAAFYTIRWRLSRAGGGGAAGAGRGEACSPRTQPCQTCGYTIRTIGTTGRSAWAGGRSAAS